MRGIEQDHNKYALNGCAYQIIIIGYLCFLAITKYKKAAATSSLTVEIYNVGKEMETSKGTVTVQTLCVQCHR